MQRLADYQPPPNFHALWHEQVRSFGLDEDTTAALLDEGAISELLSEFPFPSIAGHFHACTHTTFSPNVIRAPEDQRPNVIPSQISIEVDIRTLPGETADDVDAHLRSALGDLYQHVEVEPISSYESTMSPVDTPLWSSLARAVSRPFPQATIAPHILVGFTDAHHYRRLGAVAYGAGLFSAKLDPMSYAERFHGNDERVDVESVALSTQFFMDVARDFLG